VEIATYHGKWLLTGQSKVEYKMKYVFDHEWQKERKRLANLEAGFDPGTIRYLETIGIEEGWHCLEVGAGGGSIAEWLCKRVGLTGHVVATDLQTKFIEAINEPNLEVRKHDIASDKLEENFFDLAHTRAVLEHVPRREEALQRMITSIKAGGWFLLKAHDFISSVPVSQLGGELFTRATASSIKVLTEAGFDPDYGRKIGTKLRGAGLVDVQVEGRLYELGGERPITGVWPLVFQRVKNRIVELSLMTEAEVDEASSVMYQPEFWSAGQTGGK
jgi:SAM-dependent methyltransferase